MRKMILAMAIAFLVMGSCASTGAGGGSFTIQEAGNVNGKAVQFYTIRNSNGMEVTFSNYGAAICSVKASDKNGTVEELVYFYRPI